MPRSYNAPGVRLSLGAGNNTDQVRELQADLRALGYLHHGIDGDFGSGTEQAVRCLQHDLINAGRGRLDRGGDVTPGDGLAPVAVRDYNVDANGVRIVNAIDGTVDTALAGCIERMLADPRFPKIPRSVTPALDNKRALLAIANSTSARAPAPFILAMVRQESNSRHYREPTTNDADDFVTIGLDRNRRDSNGSVVKDSITSRGYGVGQYTIFHHPPRAEEVSGFIVDPLNNVSHAFAELRLKFDRFVVGPDSRADDRTAEHAMLGMRLCKYPPADKRYLKDCRNCALAVRKVDIAEGTPLYVGASKAYRTTDNYRIMEYRGVPVRAEFPCDWPYAARRYNGGGIDSFHYQTRILLNLAYAPPPAPE